MPVIERDLIPLPRVPSLAEGTLIFQEICDAQTLRQHFALRYHVYQHRGFLPSCADALDIDAYDLHSRFLGAWRMGSDGPEMVGGVRMVQRDAVSPLRAEIRAMLDAARDPSLRGMASRPTAFPSEKAFDLAAVLARCDREGLALVEFSRTVCLPAWRGLRVGFGLVNGIHAMAMAAGIPLGIGSTPPNLRDFYARQGCQMLPARNQYYADLHTDAYAMLVDLRNLPEAADAAAHGFMAEVARDGCFRIAPTTLLAAG